MTPSAENGSGQKIQLFGDAQYRPDDNVVVLKADVNPAINADDQFKSVVADEHGEIIVEGKPMSTIIPADPMTVELV